MPVVYIAIYKQPLSSLFQSMFIFYFTQTYNINSIIAQCLHSFSSLKLFYFYNNAMSSLKYTTHAVAER